MHLYYATPKYWLGSSFIQGFVRSLGKQSFQST